MGTMPGAGRGLAVGLALAAAALTATACGSSGGAGNEGAGTDDAARAPSEVPPPVTSPSPTPRSTDRATGVRACTGVGTKASVADDPGGDLMLTATNTSGAPCAAFGAPRLTAGDSSSAVDPARGTAPRTPAVLGPGESAYAGILMAWEPDDFVTVDTVSLAFAADAAGRRTTGRPVTVALPGKTPYEELDAEVTYWQHSREEAHADG
ncbi:DUF4232 domain-containing protein [Streptomyces sp. NPDC087300]|uniref:DUF4232 domain-containing protein n=1 Tax=Streptomyces sp. NPDC087300 TaxID=3365780 RepID=UPI003819AC18